MHLSEQKAKLRADIKERIGKLTKEQWEAESRSVSRRILDNLPKDAVVAAYSPLRSEVDVRLVLKELVQKKQPLYLPVFDGKEMEYRQVTDLSGLVEGDLSILEPPKTNPLLDRSQLDIVLVPGRAFDLHGNRLGRGNGGYDKWMEVQRKEYPHTKYWGVALECQIVKDVPHEEHDERMDAIVTARGLQEITYNH